MRNLLLSLVLLPCMTLVSQAQVSTKVSSQKAVKAHVEVSAKASTYVQSTKPVNAVSSVIQAANIQKAAPLAAGEDLEAFYLPPSGILYAGIYDASQGGEDSGINPGEVAWYIRPDFYVKAREEHKFLNYCSWDEENDHVTVWTDGNDEELEMDSLENGFASIWGANYVPQVSITQTLLTKTYSIHGEASDGSEVRGVWWSSSDDFIPLTSATMYASTYSGYSDVTMDANDNWFDTELKTMGFGQYVSGSQAHVYAESVYAFLYSETADAEAPLNGETLTATVYTFNEDGSMVEFAKATATDENIVGKTTYGGYKLKFIFQEEDPFMGVVESPIVLPAEDMMVVITGFENVTAPTHPLIQAVGEFGISAGGYALLEDNSFGTVGYRNDPDVPQFDWNIGFDGKVIDVELANDDYVVFPVEGGLGISGTGTDEETGEEVVYNDIDFYSSVNHEEWEILDAPEWVTGVSYNEDYFEKGWMLWYLEAEALPEGVEGREGVVTFYVYGKEFPVKVKQGEVAEEDFVTEINVEREVGQGYGVTSYEPDFAGALEYLGIESPTDATLVGINADGSEEAAPGPGGIDGWCDADGNFIGWGQENTRICVKFFPSVPQYEICDMNGADEVGKTYTVKYALKANDKKAIFSINVTFIEKEVHIYKPEIIKTIEIAHLEKAATAYCEEEPAPTFDVAEVCSALGIENISEAKAYIVNVTDGNFVENTGNIDGWRNADGDAASWAESANGFCLKLNNPASGEFDYTGAHDGNFQVGDTFVAQWGIVANEKAVLLKVTITFAEDPTGISELNADEQNNVIYNLNGVRMQNTQQKGIYIINGKKVVR
ncbi:MAG: DUF4859 domain-containing protein [Prevotella sp.]|nr:DUF4859 domain-containing protein [Prevotella sp.]